MNKLHTLTFWVFHVFCKDHDKGVGLMPKSRFSPPVVLAVKLVFWSNDQKKHLAGLGLYDVVKSREGGLKGLKATNHMEGDRKTCQKT